MATVPPPTGEKDLSSPVWQNWFNQLQTSLVTTETGDYEARIVAIEGDYYSKTGGGISGNVVINGTLNCKSDVDFDNDLNVDGDLVVDLTSKLTGAVDCDSTLNVDGALTAQTTSNLKGAVDCDSTLNVDGALTAQSTSLLKGAVDCDTTLNVDGNGTFRGINQFGNIAGGHYAEFEADGTLELNGDATTFRDELIDATNLKFKGVRITLDDAENTLNFSTSTDITDDYVYYNVQLNHDRKNGASVFPHVHWFQEENNTPNFLIQYRWQKNGSAKTTAWTNYKMTTNAFTYTSGTLNQITYGAAITPPSGDNVSDIIQIRFTRDNSNESTVFTGVDAYTGAAKITSVDIHIETNTLGSRSEYSK